MIRKMTYADIKQVKKIDQRSFKIDAQRITPYVATFIEKSNNTCLVYESKGKILGYNILHHWGNFASFGPFGVDPEAQGNGVGKALLEETMKIFSTLGYKKIGIETMPWSCYNIALYTKAGFNTDSLTFRMKSNVNSLLGALNSYKSKPSDPKPALGNIHGHSRLSQQIFSPTSDIELALGIKYVKDISDKLSEGLDFSPELQLLKNCRFGKILILFEDKEPVGFALMYDKSIFEKEAEYLDLRRVVILNSVDAIVALNSIFDVAIRYGKEHRISDISISCNGYNQDVFNYLIKGLNFRIYRNLVRMTISDEPYMPSLKGIQLSRWCG